MVTGLPPVLPPRCRVLVLGSMPGDVSLARREYYAHPRNRFWLVMGELCGAVPELDYAQRLARLGVCGIGVWDVLQHCVRVGSLDASIVRETEVPNDLGGLFVRHPSIAAVALNGAKAAQTFRRRVLPGLPEGVVRRLALFDMPSTSPANASWSLHRLLVAWSRIRPFLDRPPAE